MTDNPDDKPEDNEQETEHKPPSQAQKSEHMIPKSRFDEINTKYRDLLDQLEAQEKARKAASDKQLQEQNEYKQLYEQLQDEIKGLQAEKAKALRYADKLKVTNDLRLERLPETIKALAPNYDDPVALSEWLDTAEKHIPETEQKKPPPPRTDGSSGSADNRDMKPLSAGQQQLVDLARNFGYKVDDARVSQFARQPIQPTEDKDKE